MAFTRIGFGQVEENQMSYYHTGQMFASLPLDTSVQLLQNGEFMYYDYASGKVTAEPKVEGVEPMLVLNEIKVYEDYLANKDFAMMRVGENYVTNPAAIGRITSVVIDPATGGAANPYGGGSKTVSATIDPAHTEYGYRMDGIAPRVVKTNIGDIYTTNMVATGVDYAVGNILVPTVTETTVNDLTKGGTATQKTLVLTKNADGETAVPTKGMAWAVVKVYTMPDGQPGLKLQRVQ